MTDSLFEAGPIFDVPAALRLADAIARVPPGTDVVIDFTHTRACHDFALAALSHALIRLGANGPRVRTRGLSRHHQRVLRYLGDAGTVLA
jgi:hypothetical protein